MRRLGRITLAVLSYPIYIYIRLVRHRLIPPSTPILTTLSQRCRHEYTLSEFVNNRRLAHFRRKMTLLSVLSVIRRHCSLSPRRQTPLSIFTKHLLLPRYRHALIYNMTYYTMMYDKADRAQPIRLSLTEVIILTT